MERSGYCTALSFAAVGWSMVTGSAAGNDGGVSYFFSKGWVGTSGLEIFLGIYSVWVGAGVCWLTLVNKVSGSFKFKA